MMGCTSLVVKKESMSSENSAIFAWSTRLPAQWRIFESNSIRSNSVRMPRMEIAAKEPSWQLWIRSSNNLKIPLLENLSLRFEKCLNTGDLSSNQSAWGLKKKRQSSMPWRPWRWVEERLQRSWAQNLPFGLYCKHCMIGRLLTRMLYSTGLRRGRRKGTIALEGSCSIRNRHKTFWNGWKKIVARMTVMVMMTVVMKIVNKRHPRSDFLAYLNRVSISLLLKKYTLDVVPSS
mmetsp:Transcript_820/g.1676  ORF Transcript_820/g.1676 Transcript_820/m.1676 type:complete len:233 (-) Transcript_820:51-749(-)